MKKIPLLFSLIFTIFFTQSAWSADIQLGLVWTESILPQFCEGSPNAKGPDYRSFALGYQYQIANELRQFPNISATVAMAGSLLDGATRYVDGKGFDPLFTASLKLSEHLSLEEKAFVLQNAFDGISSAFILSSPRLQKLKKLVPTGKNPQEYQALAAHISPGDIRDLLVFNALAMASDHFAKNKPLISRLIKKDGDYTEVEKMQLCKLQLDIVNWGLDIHRKLAETGQMELAAMPFVPADLTAFDDPIWRNINISGDFHSNSFFNLNNKHTFSLLEDAFKLRPKGFMPSPGIMSPNLLDQAVDQGFDWILLSGLNLLNKAEDDVYSYEKGGKKLAVFIGDPLLEEKIESLYKGANYQVIVQDILEIIRRKGQTAKEKGEKAKVILSFGDISRFAQLPDRGLAFRQALYTGLKKENNIQFLPLSKIDFSSAEKWPDLAADSWNTGDMLKAKDRSSMQRQSLLVKAISDYFRRGELKSEKKQRLERDLLKASHVAFFTEGLDISHEKLFANHLQDYYHSLGISAPVYISRLADPLSDLSHKITVDGLIDPIDEWSDGTIIQDFATISGQPSIIRLIAKVENENCFIRIDPAFDLSEMIGKDLEIAVYFAAISGQKASLTTKDGFLLEEPAGASIKLDFRDRSIDITNPVSEGLWLTAGAVRKGVLDQVFEMSVPLSVLGLRKDQRIALSVMVSSGDKLRMKAPRRGFAHVIPPIFWQKPIKYNYANLPPDRIKLKISKGKEKEAVGMVDPTDNSWVLSVVDDFSSDFGRNIEDISLYLGDEYLSPLEREGDCFMVPVSVGLKDGSYRLQATLLDEERVLFKKAYFSLNRSNPVILHRKLAYYEKGRDLYIQGAIQHNGNLKEAWVYYAGPGSVEKRVPMFFDGQLYTAIIPKDELPDGELLYRLEAILGQTGISWPKDRPMELVQEIQDKTAPALGGPYIYSKEGQKYCSIYLNESGELYFEIKKGKNLAASPQFLYDAQPGFNDFSLRGLEGGEYAITVTAKDKSDNISRLDSTVLLSQRAPIRLALAFTVEDGCDINGDRYARLILKPLLEELLKANIKASVFISPDGLYSAQWFQPAAAQLLKNGLYSGLLDILGGPFAWTNLAFLDDASKKLQIEEGKKALQNFFEIKPQIAFLPGGGWDPSLAPLLANQGYHSAIVPGDILPDRWKERGFLTTKGPNDPGLGIYSVDQDLSTSLIQAFGSGDTEELFATLWDSNKSRGDMIPIIAAVPLGPKGSDIGFSAQDIEYYVENFKTVIRSLTQGEKHKIIQLEHLSDIYSSRQNQVFMDMPKKNMGPVLEKQLDDLKITDMDDFFSKDYGSLLGKELFSSISQAISVEERLASSPRTKKLLELSKLYLCVNQRNFGLNITNPHMTEPFQRAYLAQVPLSVSRLLREKKKGIIMEDLHGDGRMEILFIGDSDLLVFSRYGARLIHWFDLNTGTSMGGFDLLSPLGSFAGPDYPVLSNWQAPLGALPGYDEKAKFYCGFGSLGDEIYTKSSDWEALYGELFQVSQDDESLIFSLEKKEYNLVKEFKFKGGKLDIRYSITNKSSGPLPFELKIHNNFSPDPVSLLEKGRDYLDYQGDRWRNKGGGPSGALRFYSKPHQVFEEKSSFEGSIIPKWSLELSRGAYQVLLFQIHR